MIRSSFMFLYKKIKYIVLAQLLNEKLKKKNKYELVPLTFFQLNNLDHSPKVEANVNRLLIDAKTLRTYFEIEYFENLGDILSQFADSLNDFIPGKVPKSYFNDQKKQ